MTVCYGPSLGSMIFTLIAAILVPSLIIYVIHKKWKPKTKSLFVLVSVIIFIILFIVVSTSLFQLFTPPCGPGISCIPFEFYPENNTCTFGNDLINHTDRCNQLQEQYLSQLESDEKYCPEGTITNLF